jgi:hypothetical protein
MLLTLLTSLLSIDNDMNEVVVDDKVIFVVVIEVILIRTALFCRLLYELLSTTVLQVFMGTKIRNTAYNGASTVQERVRVPVIKFRFLWEGKFATQRTTAYTCMCDQRSSVYLYV